MSPYATVLMSYRFSTQAATGPARSSKIRSRDSRTVTTWDLPLLVSLSGLLVYPSDVGLSTWIVDSDSLTSVRRKPYLLQRKIAPKSHRLPSTTAPPSTFDASRSAVSTFRQAPQNLDSNHTRRGVSPKEECSVHTMEPVTAEAASAPVSIREDAESKLESFRQGIRMLTRQMKQTHQHGGESGGKDASDLSLRNDSTPLESSAFDTPQHLGPRKISQGEWDFNKLIAEQSGDVAADLLNLQNAIRMLQDHVWLSSEEASQAQTAQVDVESWKQRALTAEANNVTLAQNNEQLESRIEKLSMERRVLVKECRLARKLVVQAKQECRHEQMERYALEALTAHEKRLSRSRTSSDYSQSPTEGDYGCMDQRASPSSSMDDQEEKKMDDELVHARCVSPTIVSKQQGGQGDSMHVTINTSCDNRNLHETQASSLNDKHDEESTDQEYMPLQFSQGGIVEHGRTLTTATHSSPQSSRLVPSLPFRPKFI